MPGRAVVWYGLGEPRPGGVGLAGERIVGGDGADVMATDELAIPGRHNVSNALAAIATARWLGIAPAAIRRAAMGFTGVEHRLETVATVDGVRFVNDSQGTQPDAVIAALRAFDPPIVLIAGGRDKDVDLSALPPVVAERAVAAVLIGESGPSLERLFRAAGLARTERAATLEEAVRTADAIARETLAAGDAGTRDRAAEPGRRQLRHVRGLRRPRPGVQGGRRRDRRRARPEEDPMTDALRPRLPAGLGAGRGRTGRRADRPRDRSTSAARTPARQKATAAHPGAPRRPTTRSS